MQYTEPSSHQVDIHQGRLSGATDVYQKQLKDLGGIYADKAAFEQAMRSLADEVVYEVTYFRPDALRGDLIFGVTRMSPGRIGGEFFMTRGHIHAIGNRPETYYGESGVGVMLLESPHGDVRVIAIKPRTLCYVPPFWIHRSVNTGDDQLVMSFCYPSDSGQDYSVIERSGGMKQRIVADAAGWKAVPNEAYCPRSDKEIEALLMTSDANS